MSAQVIDGKALAAAFRDEITARAHAMREAGNPPKLDAVLVDSGDNGARVYAQNQARTCESMEIGYRLHELPEGSSRSAIERLVMSLNLDDDVSAIMVHMPLPDGVDPYEIKKLIDPDKDAESVNPMNIGNAVYGRSMRAPCTAVSALKLIDSTGIDLKGKRCVIVGASSTVGRPLAVLLMQREATVVSCNKFTHGLDELCSGADVLIAAAGVPGLVTAPMVRPGAVVIDIGVNRVEDPGSGKLVTVGDVAYDEVSEVVGWITPVPGGVGPMTVAVLLHQVVELCGSRHVTRAQEPTS